MPKCEACKGEGKIITVDVMTARSVSKICDVCYGSGLVNEAITADGVYIKPDPGVLHFFSYRKDGKFIATIQVVYQMAKAKDYMHFVGNILNMWTKEKYRNQGYCDVLLSAAKRFNGGRVKFLVTSYVDSSVIGRKFLIKRGFELDDKKQILIWRRDGKKNENNSNAAIRKDIGTQSGSADKGAGSAPETGTPGTANAG